MRAGMALFCAYVHDHSSADINHPLEFDKGRGIDPILGITKLYSISLNGTSDLPAAFHSLPKHGFPWHFVRHPFLIQVFAKISRQGFFADHVLAGFCCRYDCLFVHIRW